MRHLIGLAETYLFFMKVLYHKRMPCPTHVSIERLFAEICKHLPADIRVEDAISPRLSQGVLARLQNLRHAGRQSADVHHIIGDVNYLAFALPADQLILTIHDCAALNRLAGIQRRLLKYFWFSGPISRARIVTAVSEVTKQELQRWFGQQADHVRVVPNCVGSEFVRCVKPFPACAPVVLQIGTGWNKNLVRVAEAIQQTGCKLEIVGTPSDPQLQALRSSQIEYKVLGKLTDTELLLAYQRCDVVVFASLYEGFGLPVLEGQATGRPVVTSDRSSMPEVAGEGAALVDPECVPSIRQAILQIVKDQSFREHLIEKGLQNVRKYQPESISAKYAALYREIFE